MKKISKRYFRDSKCEEIERKLHEHPFFEGWTVKRLKSTGGLFDFEDSFEILDGKGKCIDVCSESELDLSIAMGMLEMSLLNRYRLGFLRNFGPRGIIAFTIVIIAIPLIVMVPLSGYIMSLPTDQALVSFLLLFGVLGGIFCMIFISQKSQNKKRVGISREPEIPMHERMRLITETYGSAEEILRMKKEDPQQYIQKVRELSEKLTTYEDESENEDSSFSHL